MTSGQGDDDSRFHAMIAFAAVIIVIGFPLWWKTTEVYRASLQYEKINQLYQSEVKNYVDVTVLMLDLMAPHAKLREIAASLQQHMPYHREQSVQVHYTFEVRHLYQEEKFAIDKATSIEDADERLNHLKSSPGWGNLNIVIIPPSSPLVKGSQNTASITMGRHRTGFIKTGADPVSSVPHIISLLDTVLIKRQLLEQTFSSAKDMRRLQQKPSVNLQGVKLSPVYDITFTLLVPEPVNTPVTWNVPDAIRNYIKPFTDELKNFIDFNINSQTLYLLHLPVEPVKNSKTSDFKVTVDHLSHVINPVEAKLGSHVSTNPALHFLVYVAPQEQTPLTIYDEEDKPSDTNAVLIPGWGGLLLYNVPRAENVTTTHQINMAATMSVFLSQLRLLLGLHDKSSNSLSFSSFDKRSIHDWEVDCLLRRRAIENIAVATSTLQSLAHLLTEISNIVISDEVAKQVATSIEAVELCRTYLDSGNIAHAYMYSKNAFIAAEKAFFDPSMLALLYFPDGQKYAIYIPLFLPVGIPVLQSIPSIWAWLRKKYRSSTAHHVKTE